MIANHAGRAHCFLRSHRRPTPHRPTRPTTTDQQKCRVRRVLVVRLRQRSIHQATACFGRDRVSGGGDVSFGHVSQAVARFRMFECESRAAEATRPTDGKIKGARFALVGRSKSTSKSATSREVHLPDAPRRIAQAIGKQKQRAPCRWRHGGPRRRNAAWRRVHFGHSVQAERRGTLRRWLAPDR